MSFDVAADAYDRFMGRYSVVHETFDEWWEPYTGGVGPAGGYVKSLSADDQAKLREACREVLPPEPFTLTSVAWAVRGLA